MKNVNLSSEDGLRLLAITTKDMLTKHAILQQLGECDLVARNKLIDSGFNAHSIEIREQFSLQFGQIDARELEEGMKILNPSGCSNEVLDVTHVEFIAGKSDDGSDDTIAFGCDKGHLIIGANETVQLK